VGSTGISRELDAIGIRNTGVGPDVLEGSLMTLVKEQFVPDPEVGAVVVGFDEHISFPKMMKAATYLNNPETLFVGTNIDQRFPMPSFVVPGTGSMVKAIETCAERNAVIMGKPENYLCDIFFKEEIKRDSQKFLMIGDRLNTDILFGNKNGFKTLLVESGVHKIDKVAEIVDRVNNGESDAELEKQIPDFIISGLGDLFNNYDD
jgi:phosphoglycolate phosphatase